MKKYYRYMRRTVEHIHRVQNNMLRVVTDFKDELDLSDETCRVLMHNVMNHDRSKFSKVQFIPYIELTEYYHQRKVLGNSKYQYPSQEIKDSVNIAVTNHYILENHHPEKYPKGESSYFGIEQCIEIICDLQAMAQEFDEGDCEKYFEEVWRPKHTGFITDDFEYQTSIQYMRKVIRCFKESA